jgi:uncharacterized membrane protein YphA (DoxX/SURF4 family)
MTNDVTNVRSANPLTILLSNKIFILVIRFALGGLLLYSSIHKIAEPNQFAVAIRAYKLLPLQFTNIFAIVVGWSEALTGVMLIFGVMTRKAAGAATILLVLFTVAVVSTVVRGMVIDCGCFSTKGGEATDAIAVLRNIFLICAALMVMWFDRGYVSLSKFFGAR